MKKERRLKKKKVWFLLMRAFPKSGDSFTLHIIMDGHCSPVFSRQFELKVMCEICVFLKSSDSFGPLRGVPCVLVLI